MKVRSVAITAIEEELPSAVVRDADLARELGVDESIVSRWSEGRERRESPDREGPTALTARAGARVLAARGLAATDVDFIVYATNTPDMFFPGAACLLQAALGCRTIGGLDVRSQCTGFLTALDVASRFVTTGMYGRVLVAAGDTPSHFNARDSRSPHLSCAMSDLGAVALVEAGNASGEAGGGRGEVLAVQVRNDGSLHRDYWCEYPASRFREGTTLPERNRLPLSKFQEGLHYPSADLDHLRALALERIPEVFDEVLARANLSSVDATLITHLDSRVEKELPAKLGARAGRIVRSKILYAGGSSLPALFARAIRSGELESGQTVALATSGSGASWGSAIVRVP